MAYDKMDAKIVEDGLLIRRRLLRAFELENLGFKPYGRLAFVLGREIFRSDADDR